MAKDQEKAPPFTIDGTTIKVNTPFIHNGNQVGSIRVRELSYQEFVRMTSSVQMEVYSAKDRSKIDPQVLMSRHRRNAQVSANYENGSKVPMDDGFFYQMPRKLYTAMYNLMDDIESPAGEVINKGDGIDVPLLYRLGTPLKIVSSGEDGQKTLEISELEFLAKTGGDIERVVAATSDQDKVLALLEDCCSPVSPDATLLRLTSDMIAQMTSSDGITIQNRVLTDFL